MSGKETKNLRRLTDDFDTMISQFVNGLELDVERMKEIAVLLTKTAEESGYDILHYIGASFVVASSSMETIMQIVAMSSDGIVEE